MTSICVDMMSICLNINKAVLLCCRWFEAPNELWIWLH